MSGNGKNKSFQFTAFHTLFGMAGWVISLAALAVGGTLLFFDLFNHSSHPYIGVVIYMLTPGFISMGIGLIVLGAYLKYKHKAKYQITSYPALIFDFNKQSTRRNFIFISVGITFFLIISAIGSYRSFHFTESTQFCGLTCHKVMQPEFTTYNESPHTKVACVECHIGAGADWYVKSKMSGLYQVFSYTFNWYHLPIETPVKGLRPARETCEECHWPEKFSGNMERTSVHYMKDEANTPYVLKMLLKVGGGEGDHATGIHWHIASGHKVEYYPADPQRMEIPWVKLTNSNGETVIYKAEGSDEKFVPEDKKIRTMDCVDCHNRPSHIFKDPLHVVNEAMSKGDLDPALPNVKSVAMEIFDVTYKTTDEALAAIREKLTGAYLTGSNNQDLEIKVEKGIAALSKLYKTNFFPESKVDWTTHPDYKGHFRWDGCYRCHDGKHKSDDGKVISHECNACHVIIGQAEGKDAVKNMKYGDVEFKHPMGMGFDPANKCTDCHAAPASNMGQGEDHKE